MPEKQSSTEYYLPFHAADHMGVLDHTLVEAVPIAEASTMVESGALPNKAGLVRVGREMLGAFDLVDVVFLSEDELALQPTEKARVDGEDCTIKQPGDIVFASPHGVKLFGEAITTEGLPTRRQRKAQQRQQAVGRAQVTAHRRNRDGLHVVRFVHEPYYSHVRVEADGTVIARSR